MPGREGEQGRHDAFRQKVQQQPQTYKPSHLASSLQRRGKDLAIEQRTQPETTYGRAGCCNSGRVAFLVNVAVSVAVRQMMRMRMTPRVGFPSRLRGKSSLTGLFLAMATHEAIRPDLQPRAKEAIERKDRKRSSRHGQHDEVNPAAGTLKRLRHKVHERQGDQIAATNREQRSETIPVQPGSVPGNDAPPPGSHQAPKHRHEPPLRRQSSHGTP